MNAAVLEGSRVTSSTTFSDISTVESNNGELSNDFNGVDRCCCRLMHVKRGTYVCSFVLAFLIGTNVLVKIAGYSEIAWDWELIFLIVDTIALASMFCGIYTERAAFIQPFIVLSLITTSLLILLAVYMFCAAYDPNSYAGQDLEHELNKRLSDTAHQLSVQLQSMISIVATVFLVFTLNLLAFYCWFIWLAIQCAKYFRILDEKSAHPPSTKE
ncbi:hypothetical protein M3Y97_00166900 [Aphelenchoides bicaudatus]|nr:hypothetical protein M3Y97_00166900 [Aphelenchoides bicaudatus]